MMNRSYPSLSVMLYAVALAAAAPALAHSGTTTVFEYDDSMQQTLSYVYDSVADLTLSATHTDYGALGRQQVVRRFANRVLLPKSC